MNPAAATDGAGRTRFELRDRADINRLILHLFTRFSLPAVTVHFETLPAVLQQRAQHRITRISATSHLPLAAGMAAMTFLVGAALMWTSFHSMIWTPRQWQQNLTLLAIAMLYAGVIGAALVFLFTRVRLLLTLRRLRRDIAAGERLDLESLRYHGSNVPRSNPAAAEATGQDAEEVADSLQNSVLSRPRPPWILVRRRADVGRVVLYLLSHRRLPHVSIDVDGTPPLDVQRAQHRISQLSETCYCLIGPVLAGLMLLSGAFIVQWVASQNWDWWVPEGRWGAMGLVSIAAAAAALLGVAIEVIWARVRLVRIIRSVRHRLTV
jgi:hypothetical protein